MAPIESTTTTVGHGARRAHPSWAPDMRLLRELSRRKLRTALTITGITIGIWALVVFDGDEVERLSEALG